MAKKGRKKVQKPRYPIKHWSHSSLMSYLRNPLAWYKRYVERVYDMPSTPASVVGRSAHVALEHFYQGEDASSATAQGLRYLRSVSDSEIDFGRAKSKTARKAKRRLMEREYAQAVYFYLSRPPRHEVIGVEVSATVAVEGLPLPVKAVSDLVVAARGAKGMVDIVDHKFVNAFSKGGASKTLFMMQALFNYYTVRERYGLPVRYFIIYECKKTRNKDGKPQLRRYVIDYRKEEESFAVFHRLLNDASADLANRRTFLPNPSDMFEGENSFDIYRLGLVEPD
jgi:hypothetical protein